MRPFFKWLVTPPQNPESCLHVIAWWELRRIPYNLIVGLLGIAGLAIFLLFIHLAHELKPGDDAVEPLAIILAAVAINILYTAGWMAELLLRLLWKQKSPHIGPVLFKFALYLSVCAIFFPGAWWFVVWIIRSLW